MKKTNYSEQKEIFTSFPKALEEDIYFERCISTSNMTSLHYHHHYELYYLLSGKQKYFINNSSYEIKKGDIVLIPKNVLHKTTSGLGGLRILINFNDKFLLQFLSPRAINVLLTIFENRIVHPSPDEAKNIIRLGDQFLEVYKSGDKDKQFLYFFQILMLLHNVPAVRSDDNNQSVPLIHEIAEYTQTNYATITNLNDVAEALYISKYHICHLFSKHLNLSFNEYLTKIRLKNAEERLINTKQTVTEIGESCGFHTTAYFCNVFKKQFGISPLKYRTLVRTK